MIHSDAYAFDCIINFSFRKAEISEQGGNMERIARFLQRRYRIILLTALAVFTAGIVCAGRISIVTDAKEMLPQSNPYVQSFNQITEVFTSATMLITIEGSERKEMIEAARELGQVIEQDQQLSEYVQAVQLQTDREFLYTWALMMQDNDDLEKSLRLLDDFTLAGFLTSFNDNLEDTYAGDDAEDEINSSREEREAAGFLSNMEQAADTMRKSLENPNRYPIEAAASDVADLFLIGDTWWFDREGSMLIFSLIPNFQIDDIDSTMACMGRIRTLLDEAQRKRPSLVYGYAGDVAQNYDEQIALGSDSVIPSIIALLVILFLFLFSFEKTRLVLMALAALIIGIVATLLVVSLTIGSLNILTSFFTVLLIGLGIDFGIHIITNLDRYRSDGLQPAQAITATYRNVAKAIILGAVTTAVAFYSLILTDSIAIRQFGVVAGTGVLITLLSELFVLPSLVLMFPARRYGQRKLPLFRYSSMGKIGSNMEGRWRWAVIILSVGTLTLLAPHISQLEFIYDMGEVGPQESVSVRTQQKIEEKFGLSPLPVMTSARSLEETRRLTEEVKEVPMVAAVGSVSELIRESEVQTANLRLITEARDAYQPVLAAALDGNQRETLSYEIQRLEWNMIELGDLAVAALGEGNMVQQQRDAMIHEVIGADTGAKGRETFQNLIESIANLTDHSRLDHFQSAFSAEMHRRARTLLSPARIMTIRDIPESMRADLVSGDGKSFLITVSPDREVSEKVGLFRFRSAMEEVDPGFTGTIPIFVEFTASIASEVGRATLYIAAAFFLLMLITFRSLKYTLISAATLSSAILMMFGLFPLMGIKFNATNVMILPLIFGLGIAFQIHIIHRYLQEGDIGTAVLHSGKGVLLSALTTMIGFGSLGLAGSMEAARQLGIMLFVGIGLCLIITFTLLPALLSFTRVREVSKVLLSFEEIGGK